ncbi:MAG: hypothetical protein WC292_07240 [Clostridia bacterium]
MIFYKATAEVAQGQIKGGVTYKRSATDIKQTLFTIDIVLQAADFLMNFEVDLNGNATNVVQAVLAISIWAYKPRSRLNAPKRRKKMRENKNIWRKLSMQYV